MHHHTTVALGVPITLGRLIRWRIPFSGAGLAGQWLQQYTGDFFGGLQVLELGGKPGANPTYVLGQNLLDLRPGKIQHVDPPSIVEITTRLIQLGGNEADVAAIKLWAGLGVY